MKRQFGTWIVAALLGVLGGFAGAAIWSSTGMGQADTRAYLVANPDILPEMAEAYERQRSEDRLAGVSQDVKAPFEGAVLGNPNGSVTLVEFTDYACGYCRASAEDVRALIASNPDLRVVMREWPIFEGSDAAARMALAAAKQGRYAAFHDALFAAGSPTEANIAAAAQQAGLDMERAQAFAASEAAEFELTKNMALARQLGFTGTPSWIVGDEVIEGAVGQEALAAAIARAAKS